MLLRADAARPRTVEELLGPGVGRAIDRLDLLSRRVLAGKLPGERRSKRRGRSVEFDDYRAYIPGDDPRHVDWRVLARLDRLVVKLFREDEDLSLHLVLDCSASMFAGVPDKGVFAHRLAMALGYVGLVNQNRVLCTLVGSGAGRGAGGVLRLAGLRGRNNVRRLGQFLLTSLEAGPAAPAPGAFALGLREAALDGSLRGVVVVLSDFLVRSGLERGLNALAGGPAGTRDAWCLRVRSPGEEDPGSEAAGGLFGDLRLIDAEDSGDAEVTLSPALLNAYARRREAWDARVRGECLRRGIAFVAVRSDANVAALALGALRRGGLLRG